jgi:hypothetical protein
MSDPTLVEKIGKKLNKYESFINMNIEDLISENVDFSLFERAEHDVSTSEIARNNNPYSEYTRAHNLIQLDYQKVKEALARAEV